jgi:hypothetical protein
MILSSAYAGLFFIFQTFCLMVSLHIHKGILTKLSIITLTDLNFAKNIIT